MIYDLCSGHLYLILWAWSFSLFFKTPYLPFNLSADLLSNCEAPPVLAPTWLPWSQTSTALICSRSPATVFSTCNTCLVVIWLLSCGIGLSLNKMNNKSWIAFREYTALLVSNVWLKKCSRSQRQTKLWNGLDPRDYSLHLLQNAKQKTPKTNKLIV